MLPYYVGLTLLPILYIGKRLDLRDEDFKQVFLWWVPIVFHVARFIDAQYREFLGLRPLQGRAVSRTIVPEEVRPQGQDMRDSDLQSNGRDSFLSGDHHAGEFGDNSVCESEPEVQPIDIVIGDDDDVYEEDSDEDVGIAGDECRAVESNESGSYWVRKQRWVGGFQEEDR
jgi:hypothetical protein